jgi:cytochrome c biogenesis protein CcmG/thiol:disulfide interchange protein DsbE
MFRRDRIKILLIAVVGIAAFLALADFEPEQPDVMVGLWHDGRLREAPGFTLASLRGDSLSLSDFRGQVVVLNIWATWCAPCREEMPDFVRMQDELGSRGVQFIGVSIDSGGFDAVEEFANEFGANYPLVLDDGSVYGVYRGSTGVPTTYLIDREGRITKYWPGAISRSVLLPELLAML